MTALRVGIVGASGQVGLALLKSLNNDRELIGVGICRSGVSAARVAAQGLPVRIAQTDNALELKETTKDLDALVNCALPQYGTSKTTAVNRRLANALAVACRSKHLVHLSSVAVYGDFIPGDKPHFERPRPDILYGHQKLQMEHLLKRLANKHQMRCTILRVGHVYGVGLRWSESIFDLVKMETFRLPFGGQIPSNAVTITNLIGGIRNVLLNPPLQTTLNLTDCPQTTWRVIFDLHSEASGAPPVESLRQHESERRFLEAKRRGQTRLAARLLHETWSWIMHLPASYIASVPAFKAMMQRAVAGMGSERLDAILWAMYWRHFAPRIETGSGPAILPIFISEPVPGNSLNYQGEAPQECAAALQAWYSAISQPADLSASRLFLNTSTS